MAIDPYAKIAPGERLPGLPAAPWNDMLDVVSAFKGGGLGSLGSGRGGSLPGGIVTIRNDSGGALKRFSVIGADDVIINPDDNEQQFKNKITLVSTKPSLVFNQPILITQAPIRQGGCGDAMIAGVTAVKVDIQNVDDAFAAPIKDTADNFKSSPVHGFPIVWKDPAATGVKWCYVLIGSRQGAAGAWNGEGSADCPAFGIMLHNGTQTSGTRILTKGKRPDTYGCQRNFFFANEAGITHGAEGTAQSVGPCGPDMFIAAYDNSDGTPAAGEAWGPRSGTYLLKKNTGGFIVLGVVDSVNHYVLVKSDPMDFFRGIVSADVAAGGTGTITVHVGGTDTSQTISGIMNLTDCTIKGSKVGSAQWLWGESAWMFITFGTT